MDGEALDDDDFYPHAETEPGFLDLSVSERGAEAKLSLFLRTGRCDVAGPSVRTRCASTGFFVVSATIAVSKPQTACEGPLNAGNPAEYLVEMALTGDPNDNDRQVIANVAGIGLHAGILIPAHDRYRFQASSAASAAHYALAGERLCR